MNRAQLLDHHKNRSDASRRLMEKKNNDYTGPTGDDPFANFRRCEQNGICKVEQGFLVRMNDKLSRLATFANSGILLVQDETVDDTLLDMINYSILLSAWISEQKRIESTKRLNEIPQAS